VNLLRIIRPLVWASLLLGCQWALAQQDPAPPSGAVTIENLQTSLDFIEQGLQRQPLGNGEISRLREQVEFVAENAVRIRATALRKVKEEARLLDALGASPGEGEAREPPVIEEERQRLQSSISEHRGRVKSANVVLARVDALRERLVREEFNALANVLTQRTESPLSPSLVLVSIAQVGPHLAHFRDRISQWWTAVDFTRKRLDILVWWLASLVLVVAVLLPSRNWVLRHYGPDHRDESPSFTRRFRVMLAVGLSNVVLPVVSIAGLYVVFTKSAAPTPDLHHMAWILAVTLCQYFLITGLSAAAISPRYPNWRISHFTDAAAVSLFRAIQLFAVLVAILNLAWVPLSGPQVSERPPLNVLLVMDVAQGPLLTLFGATAVLVVAGTVLNILRSANWHFVYLNEDNECLTSSPGKRVRALFTLVKAGLVLGIGAALAGYVNLGVFLAQRIVWSLLLIAFTYLLRAFVAGLCSRAAGDDSVISPLLNEKLGYSKGGVERLMFWVMLAVDVFLTVAAIVFLLLIWGVQGSDIMNVAGRLFHGISIGDYTLSLLDLGVALGIFVLLFIGVRLFQGFLSNRILAQTVPDVGVRDALTTGVGYTGVIIAAIVAISSLGLELSQLAIILGALSVGIGFGLQHVVNNFVSGLILLMHRPIKAGDWIVVGQHQGYVKKINVVATEIQTFDNAEVIVPNSQLVSSEVLNWTHKSTVARVVIAVSVSYDCDPRRVEEILLACAAASGDVLRTPAATVVFSDFGDSGLVFELRVFIRQADYMLVIASDLRYAISDAFREAGISIPYPQRDIHIRSADTKPGAVAAGEADGAQSRSPGAARGFTESHKDEPGVGEAE